MQLLKILTDTIAIFIHSLPKSTLITAKLSTWFIHCKMHINDTSIGTIATLKNKL